MQSFLLYIVYAGAIVVTLVAAQSSALSEADVYSDRQLFDAICAHKDIIWVRADLDLREENWPADCEAPVVLKHNMTISGPLDQPLNYTVSFNFMARKIVIPPYGEVRLRHFTARNTRKGGGGEIDFIAYSPKGILWTDDLNKNQIICLHTNPGNLAVLPLPVNFPQFANKSQIVSLWDNYCTPRQCWQEVLHYDQFFTDVNVGSDTPTGGYVMAKSNSSKTCDEFVTSECIREQGGEACMQQVIAAFLLASSRSSSRSSRSRPLVIALPAALGGAALLALIASIAFFLTRRRRRQRQEAAAAAAAATAAAAAAATAAAKLFDGDLESGAADRGGSAGVSVAVAAAAAAGPGAALRGGAMQRGSKDEDSGSSGSKDTASGSSSSGEQGVATRAPPRHQQQQQQQQQPGELDGAGSLQDSFRYETYDDMGRCLSGRRGPHSGSLRTGASSGAALVEGTMQDGSVCTVAVGHPLGQGSYGVVFKGVWRDMSVAVKLILCDPRCSEQVATEVRLMTSETCRHPNLLRAYAYMTRPRVINRQQPAAQALQSTIRGLTHSSARRADALAVVGGAAPDSGNGTASNGPASEQAETWIVSEFCDLGALAPHVHAAKRFLFPPDTTTTTTTTAATAGPVSSSEPPLPRRPRLGLILSCLRDIAAGMAHLHSLNIVHGDLKLGNVLLTCPSTAAADGGSGAADEATNGLVLPAAGSESSAAPPPSSCSGLLAQLPTDLIAKVADFGLSRWLKEGQTHHSTKTVGTVTHMPPELLRSGKLTLSGDVYSFGIIMWELLTGSVPYRGLMYGEVVERVVVSHRRPEFPEHTPAEYRSLAEQCWAAEAAARPTFAAVLSQLETMTAAAEALQSESDARLAEMAAAAAAAALAATPPACADGAASADSPASPLPPAAAAAAVSRSSGEPHAPPTPTEMSKEPPQMEG